MRAEPLGVDRGGGDDDLEVGALRLELPQVPQQEVDVEAAFVRLVDDDGVVGACSRRSFCDLGQQDAVGHQLDQTVGAGVIMKADLVADPVAERRVQLGGNAPGHAASGNAPRLSVTEHALATPTDRQADLGQLGGLSRAGLAANHDHLIRLDRVGDPVALDGVSASVAGNGATPAVRLTTRQTFREPVLVVPLRLEWDGGTLVREYVLLIDAGARPARAADAAARNDATRTPPRRSAGAVTRPVPVLPAFAGVKSAPAGSTLYGPVAVGETLYGISAALAADAGLDRARLASAIVAANPAAFVGGDASRMLAGAMLRIPVTAEALAASSPPPTAPAEQPAARSVAASAAAPATTASAGAPAPTAPPTTAPATSAEAGRLRDMIAETRRAIAEEEARRLELTGRIERADQQIAGLLVHQNALDERQTELESAIAALESGQRTALKGVDDGTASDGAVPAARPAPIATAALAVAPATPVPVAAALPVTPSRAADPVLSLIGLEAWPTWLQRLDLILAAALLLGLAGLVVSRVGARLREAALERGRRREEEAVRKRTATVRDQISEKLSANDTRGGTEGLVVDLDSVRDRRAAG